MDVPAHYPYEVNCPDSTADNFAKRPVSANYKCRFDGTNIQHIFIISKSFMRKMKIRMEKVRKSRNDRVNFYCRCQVIPFNQMKVDK